MRAVAWLAAVAMLGVALFFPATAVKAANAYRAVGEADGTVVTVYADACVADIDAEIKVFSSAVAAAFTPPEKSDYGRAEVIYRGQKYGACWVAIGDRVVVIDDGKQDNSIFTVPVRAFKPVEAI